MRTKKENARITQDLMNDCPEECAIDYNRIACAIMDGTPKSDILSMDETNNWPETYVWLKSELSE